MSNETMNDESLYETLTIKLVFQKGKYGREVFVRVSNIDMGTPSFDRAIAAYADGLSECELLMFDRFGNTHTEKGTRESDNWLNDMLIAAEIVKIGNRGVYEQ